MVGRKIPKAIGLSKSADSTIRTRRLMPKTLHQVRIDEIAFALARAQRQRRLHRERTRCAITALMVRIADPSSRTMAHSNTEFCAKNGIWRGRCKECEDGHEIA